MNVPQFGEPQSGRSYPDRAAAFVVVERDGMIAVVRVSFPGGGFRLDLPGGGIDPGETAEQAAARECGEEAGLAVEIGAALGRADHFFVNQDGETHNTRGQFFEGAVTADAPGLKIEDDHALDWMAPHRALAALTRDSHAWAMALWLRRRGQEPGRPIRP
jgi:8-oxo-dGTP diphosphatase